MSSIYKFLSKNISNIITVGRVLLIPIIIYFLLEDYLVGNIIALILFFICSISDFLDGYLARKLKQDTKFGRFFDPLADKLVIISILITFLFLNLMIPLWTVIIIIIRDILTTVMRLHAIKKKTEIQTSLFAKIKTASQFSGITIVFFILIFQSLSKKHFPENFIQASQQVFSIEKQEQLYSKISNTIEFMQDYSIRKETKAITILKLFPSILMVLISIITLFSLFHYYWLNRSIFKIF